MLGAPHKGSAEAVAAELANEGIRGFGITAAESVTLKSDNGAAIIVLRRRVAGLSSQAPTPARGCSGST